MIYRVQWTPRGTPFPEFHDFRYQQAADTYAALLREIGHQHVTVHELHEPDSTGRTA